MNQSMRAPLCQSVARNTVLLAVSLALAMLLRLAPACPVRYLGVEVRAAVLAAPLCLRISELALVTDAQDSHSVQLGRESVQSHKPGFASGYHEFPQAVLDHTPYQRVVGENGDSLLNRLHLITRKLQIVVRIEVEDALEVPERARRKTYLRQGLGLGRRAVLPCARALMYRNTSSAA